MAEEQSLINYIKYMADIGRPLTIMVLKKFATAILRRKDHDTQIDKNKGPSDKWCQRFRKRHPEIKLRKPDKASNPRMEVTREDIEEYYDLLESTIDSLGLKDKPECIFNCDETGYMNGDLFLTWFKDLFISHCGRQRPVILIMDNLVSHLSPDIIDVAKRNRIELLCLPPNLTHLFQPLDVAVFHKFKGEYSKLMNQLRYSFTSIPREKVPHVVKFALNAMCPQDYITAFRRAGIRPVNRSMVLESGKQALRSRQEIENPGTLVDIGIIPEALIDIFPVCPEKSKTKRSTCKGARLITADKQTDQENPYNP
ncbi:uncharacterized protein LOC143061997 [Mytilus galloprovincialis]|uniref:uncharacterized protein LOC143061997 n=1 Tax=Mytilus galloprovincialis TaxID=29158 RepID=UPI003F7C3285